MFRVVCYCGVFYYCTVGQPENITNSAIGLWNSILLDVKNKEEDGLWIVG